MEISYWKSRWQKDNTGWHMQQIYPHLVRYWERLNLKEGANILVPLCGKSLDVQWLVNQDYCVIGVDVSEKAILELKDSLGISFKNISKGPFKGYLTESVQLWVGDFLKMQSSYIPAIDAIYDKAALIALPANMRCKYAAVIKRLCEPHTQMMLNCFEYCQQEMTGPPFAVFREEAEKLYGERFAIELMHEESIFDQLQKFHQRGLSSFLNEKVYHLYPSNKQKT